MPRKANGEGSIRQRGSRSWQASVVLDGRRRYISGATKREVRLKLGELRTQQARGQLAPPTRLTVAEHLDDWLAAGTVEWKPKTQQYYESLVRLHLKPAFGTRRLQSLQPSELAAQYSQWKSAARFSSGTLLGIHKALHRALRVAVQWGRLARNPLDAVERPRATRKKPNLWTIDEAHRFLSETRVDHAHVAWALLLGTGCRVGEALALTWDDVDLDARTIRIERNVSRLSGPEVMSVPKTRASVRTVGIPGFTLAALRRGRDSSPPSAERLIHRSDGRRATHDSLRWELRRACTRLGLPLPRIHDLRHLSASLLLSEGVPLPIVSARLGHSTPAITAAIYSHALGNEDVRAARALDSALGS